MSRRNDTGFTLVEIVVVIVVISLLAGLVGPLVFRNVADARLTTARAQINLLTLALEQYRLDNGYYPTSAQGLAALRARPAGEPPAENWRGPYVRGGIPNDPWGRPYVYTYPSASDSAGFALASLGRDGTPGGSGEDGDISL